MSSQLNPDRDHGPVPRRVLLVGCGKVGIGLASRLIAPGWEIFALRRSSEELPAFVSPLRVDLLNPDMGPLPEVEAMVLTVTPSIGGEERPDGYLTALENLAGALPSVPSRVVFVSSTGVFDSEDSPCLITEADLPGPATARGRRLHDGEILAERLFDAHIVRPAGIYGPGREMLPRKVTEGKAVQYARRTNRIHQDDLIATLVAMLTTSRPPRMLHAVDGHSAPLGDVVTAIADELGLAPPPRIEPEKASGKVFGGSALREFLGSLRYDSYREGYRQIIALQDGPSADP
ncbi:sugar nucleotide-binding protein [Aeromicrobium piscarium]|uniref:sugar nucleotide-binding protein n=1 Tax=Aeromicrobium piscarium TaxID=2590901 RepID=UPI001C8F4675|nr:sugar nucleotide-binding protein [Aeromicrobium piscarium]